MPVLKRRLRGALYAAGVAASLAFGAATAAAAPAPAPEGPKCRPDWCDFTCRLIGAHSGTCLEGGGCACAL